MRFTKKYRHALIVPVSRTVIQHTHLEALNRLSNEGLENLKALRKILRHLIEEFEIAISPYEALGYGFIDLVSKEVLNDCLSNYPNSALQDVARYFAGPEEDHRHHPASGYNVD